MSARHKAWLLPDVILKLEGAAGLNPQSLCESGFAIKNVAFCDCHSLISI
jgi:hypothetical protein